MFTYVLLDSNEFGQLPFSKRKFDIQLCRILRSYPALCRAFTQESPHTIFPSSFRYLNFVCLSFSILSRSITFHTLYGLRFHLKSSFTWQKPLTCEGWCFLGIQLFNLCMLHWTRYLAVQTQGRWRKEVQVERYQLSTLSHLLILYT